jgi:hypothetical protein
VSFPLFYLICAPDVPTPGRHGGIAPEIGIVSTPHP